MNYESFEQMIKRMQKVADSGDTLKRHGVDLGAFCDPLFSVVKTLMIEAFGPAAVDAISWYCYENDFGRDGLTWKNDSDMICRNVPELYKHVQSLIPNKANAIDELEGVGEFIR